MKHILSLLLITLSLPLAATNVTVAPFGTLSTGEAAHLFTLTNRSGAYMTLTDYGARIVSIHVPDRTGKLDDVIVGYGDLASFEKKDRFMGCTIGRYANRIDHASFELDGKRYELDANEHYGGEPVQCHSGRKGIDRFLWAYELLPGGVRFTRTSPDGEGGFPGNLDLSVSFYWTEDNVCRIEYKAVTDAPTVVSLSNHSYFNLKGADGGYVMDHRLTVRADSCIQNNTHLCPDLVLPVEGTPFDFRTPHRVDYRIDQSSRQLEIMHGMSACWVLDGYDGSLRQVARLYEPRSGRVVETWTTEPALLTYTARFFHEGMIGKYGPLEKFGGMLLETIHFPDSPNQPRFPSTVLRPGETYSSITEWHFSVLP